MNQSIHVALSLHQAGDTDAAKQAYQRILDSHPEHFDALHLLGLLLHETGDSRTGLTYVNRASHLRPSTAVFHNSRAVVLLALKQFREAEDAAGQALMLDSKMPEARLNMALSLIEQGELSQAEGQLNQLLNQIPEHSGGHFCLGRIALLRGDNWEAESRFRHAINIGGSLSEDKHVVNATLALAKLLLQDESQNRVAMELLESVKKTDPRNIACRLQLGIALNGQGDYSAARDHFEAVLPRAEDLAELRYHYSVCLARLEHYDLALLHAQNACRLSPRSEFWVHHARLHCETGQPVEAGKILDQAIAADNENLLLLRERAKISVINGQLDHALDCYAKILRSDYRQTDVLLAASQLCSDHQKIDQVARMCMDVLKSDPGSVSANLTLGLMLSSKFSPEHRARFDASTRQSLAQRALHHLKIAAMAKPSAETFDALATGLMRAGHHQEAIDRIDAGLELHSRFAKSYETRGVAHLELGNVDQAKIDFREAIRLSLEQGNDYRAAEAHFELSRLDHQDEGQEYIDVLKRLIEQTPFGKKSRISLRFALARRYESAQQYTAAFSQYQQANEEKLRSHRLLNDADLRRKQTEKQSEVVQRLSAAFDSAFFSRIEHGHEDERPIFIVGMPRSGTTLTEQIIASHPDCFGAGECHEIADIARSLAHRLGVGDFDQLIDPEVIARLSVSDANALGKEYMQGVEALVPQGPDSEDGLPPKRISDKMPTNFWNLGLIAAILPSAKIVHIRRDPIDVFLSCFKQNLEWPFCDLEAIGDYYLHYLKMMEHWQAVLPITIHELTYESLIHDTDRESRRLIEYCGLPWSDACANFTVTRRPVQTKSKSQVRQPIYRSSIGAWERYEKHLMPFLSKWQDY